MHVFMVVFEDNDFTDLAMLELLASMEVACRVEILNHAHRMERQTRIDNGEAHGFVYSVLRRKI